MEPAQDNSQLQEKLYKEHGLNDLQVEIYMATLNTEIGLEISEIQKMFPKLQTNLDSLNQLLNTNLIELKSKGNQQYCKAVDLEEQSILSKLNSDQKRVYNVIKDSSTEGIWIRNIKQITGLTDHQIQQSLKHLERHYIIKSIKSVKNPAQKLYILSHLTPSSEITGGTFFTDQSFDDELVNNLMYICLNFIKDHSLSPDGKLYPIDYDLYPTLFEVHTHVRENSTADKDISEDDTLQILKVMELEQMIISYDASVPVRRYNGTTAKTSTTRYKAVHTDESITEERLTDIPCGVCPAMDSCSVDTIICSNIGDYYKDWIN